MLIAEQAAFPHLLDYLCAQDRRFARGIHPNPNLPASNLQNSDGDIASDGERLRRTSGQNEHNPLPPDVAYSF